MSNSNAPGLIKQLGPEKIYGWVAIPDAKLPVTIEVNGLAVAETMPSRPAVIDGTMPVTEFSRTLAELWDYLGKGDSIQVLYGGKPLPIAGHGDRYLHLSSEESRLDEVEDRLEEGFVFNKYGQLKPSIATNAKWQDGVVGLFFDVRERLRVRFGVELQVTYGTLLGAVRERNFIGHDNDFDACYISHYHTIENVQSEFMSICEFLIDSGYQLKVKAPHTWVIVPGTKRDKFDLFFSWFTSDGEYRISFGHHGPAARKSDDFFKFRDAQLGKFTVPVPLVAEELLAQFYGPRWKTPDPGFDHRADTRKIDFDYYLNKAQVSRFYWKQFYRDNPLSGASTFAQFILPRLPPEAVLIECGCGSGRDAVFFAQHGFTVLASDRSEEGIAQARNALKESESPVFFEFSVVDVADKKQLKRFFTHPLISAAQQAHRPVLLYMRFFLHSIPVKHEDNILRAMGKFLPTGTQLCVEFRTDTDKQLKKIYGDHYRRFINPDTFAAKLADDHYLELLHFESGRGLSVFKDEDPHLCRIIARRTTAA